MTIQIESIIGKKELSVINSIISMVPSGDLEETYRFITKGNSQKFLLKKAKILTGMGSNHIWISNSKGIRILLITE